MYLTHGHIKGGRASLTYTSWHSMKNRCLNPNSADWHFLADMGERPSVELSLDRIDNEGNYEPGNCRWATQAQQHATIRHHGALPATHCKQGHQLDATNTSVSIDYRGYITRRCRTCLNARARAQRAEARSAAS